MTADPGEGIIAALEGARYRFRRFLCVNSVLNEVSCREERKKETKKKKKKERETNIPGVFVHVEKTLSARIRPATRALGDGAFQRGEGGGEGEGIVWRDVLGYELSLPSAPTSHGKYTRDIH